MLNSIYKDAIKNREKTLSALKGPQFEKIISHAKKNWIEYVPQKTSVEKAGIDSSFNSTKFQGVELWAVEAVSIKTDGKILSDRHTHGLGYPKSDPSKIASRMEVEACNESVDQVDLVMMDGSLYSQFVGRDPISISTMMKTILKCNNVVFVSKTSNASKQFKDLDSIAGDIFYYNHATRTPGFSKIYEDFEYGKDKVISSTYARFDESLPLIKIEILGGGHSENEIKQLLDKLYKDSVSGYPYALKLAHNKCKISNEHMTKLVSLLGLSNEVGSREVLN